VTELGPLVQEGLGRAVMAVAPLVLAGIVGSVVAGWLAVRLGLRDPVMTGVLRGLAVLWALVSFADELGGEALTLASETWGELGAVGRAEAAAEPEVPDVPEVPSEPEESAER
jgi:hypothetical protein